MANNYTIGQLAKHVGINPKTIRYYEEIGLITPTRAQNGYRIYTLADESRLLFIKRAKMLGLTLEEIKLILEDVQNGLCNSAQTHIKELIVLKISEIDQQINELHALKSSLNIQLQKIESNNSLAGKTKDCSCL